jgi:hypothetical protein
VAAVAAAALLYLPIVVLLFATGLPSDDNTARVVYALFALAVPGLALYAFSSRRLPDALVTAVSAGVLNAVAVAAGFVLYLMGGSCDYDDKGTIPVTGWVGAVVIYLAGAAWGLSSAARHGIWIVPLSTLAASIWIYWTATTFTGSTGVCLD